MLYISRQNTRHLELNVFAALYFKEITKKSKHLEIYDNRLIYFHVLEKQLCHELDGMVLYQHLLDYWIMQFHINVFDWQLSDDQYKNDYSSKLWITSAWIHFEGMSATGTNQWLSAKLQYLECVSNGDTTVLHEAFEISIINHLQHCRRLKGPLLLMMTSYNGNIFRVTGPFVRGIHWSPVNSPHKGQWRWALMFSLIYAWINAWVSNREAVDLRRHRVNYDVIVMLTEITG